MRYQFHEPVYLGKMLESLLGDYLQVNDPEDTCTTTTDTEFPLDGTFYVHDKTTGKTFRVTITEE